MPQISSELEALAEEAIREADGDWRAAGVQFRARLEEQPEFRKELWNRIVDQELRGAAHRLGATTRSCPTCTEAIPLDAVNCRFCGADLVGDSRVSTPQRPTVVATGGPVIRNFTLLTGWVLIVLIVILIIAFSRG